MNRAGGNLPTEFVLLRTRQMIGENKEVYDTLTDFIEHATGQTGYDEAYIRALDLMIGEMDIDIETAIFAVRAEVVDIFARLAIKSCRIYQREQEGEALSEEDITRIGEQVYEDYFCIENRVRIS